MCLVVFRKKESRDMQLDQPTADYLERMAKSGTWGDSFCLWVIARLYEIPIMIVCQSGAKNVLFVAAEGMELQKEHPLQIGQIDDFHYCSVINREKMIAKPRIMVILQWG